MQFSLLRKKSIENLIKCTDLEYPIKKGEIIFTKIYAGIFCAHKPGFLMTGHILT